jgi:hypothetical protein
MAVVNKVFTNVVLPRPDTPVEFQNYILFETVPFHLI